MSRRPHIRPIPALYIVVGGDQATREAYVNQTWHFQDIQTVVRFGVTSRNIYTYMIWSENWREDNLEVVLVAEELTDEMVTQIEGLAPEPVLYQWLGKPGEQPNVQVQFSFNQPIN